MSRPTADDLKSKTVQQFNATSMGDVAGALEVFSNATRPDPSAVPVGHEIWNSDDNAPNYSDGTAWRDAAGLIT